MKLVLPISASVLTSGSESSEVFKKTLTPEGNGE